MFEILMVWGELRHSQKYCLGEEENQDFRIVRKDVSVPKNSSSNYLYRTPLPLIGISYC